ncbi:MAG: alpha/beta hydrolase, partial [Nocardioidaceae bacterium]
MSDTLGEPYVAETLEIGTDDEGPVVATLVSRRSPDRARGAVLHLHGFCDYFFQTEMAEFYLDLGFDFYALDLRKCGRSLR